MGEPRVARLVESCLASKKAWAGSPALPKLGVMAQISNPSTGGIRESEVQGHTQLHNSLSYMKHWGKNQAKSHKSWSWPAL